MDDLNVACRIGVHVGGKRKGFDVAVIDNRRLLTVVGGLGLDEVLELVDAERPAVVGIDAMTRHLPRPRQHSG